MKTEFYTETLGDQTQVNFDDLQGEVLDRCDHSIFYAITGEDDKGRQYSATSEYCCGEFECITDIVRETWMWRNKKPYQARVLLKSIRYWRSVINGDVEAKRPMAYYNNKLKHYTQSNIDYLEKLSNQPKTGQAFNFDNDPPII